MSKTLSIRPCCTLKAAVKLWAPSPHSRADSYMPVSTCRSTWTTAFKSAYSLRPPAGSGHPYGRSLGREPFRQEGPEETLIVATRSTCPPCFPSPSFQETRSQGAVLALRLVSRLTQAWLYIEPGSVLCIATTCPTGRWPSR